MINHSPVNVSNHLPLNDNALEPAARATLAWQLSYEQKFSDFLFLLRSTREELFVIHHPQVLGDDYEELVESLNRIGDAGKKLAIVPRNERN